MKPCSLSNPLGRASAPQCLVRHLRRTCQKSPLEILSRFRLAVTCPASKHYQKQVTQLERFQTGQEDTTANQPCQIRFPTVFPGSWAAPRCSLSSSYFTSALHAVGQQSHVLATITQLVLSFDGVWRTRSHTLRRTVSNSDCALPQQSPPVSLATPSPGLASSSPLHYHRIHSGATIYA